MIIDILFLIVLTWAVFKGLHKGLIIGVFSFVAIIVGLAAAMKLSAVAAQLIGSRVSISPKLLPLLAFSLVFILTVVLVRLVAKFIEKTVELGLMGWANKLGGVLFFAAINIIVLSVVVFYAEKSGMLSPSTIASSITYSFIQPWGPKAIESLGVILPFLKNVFAELNLFFEKMNK